MTKTEPNGIELRAFRDAGGAARAPRHKGSPSTFAAQLLILLSTASFAAAAETVTAEEGAKLYAGTIQPILEKHCYECHSHANGKSKGGLILDHPTGWLKGGETAPAVVPGEPGKSLLLSAVRHEDKDLRMPKEKLGDQDIAYLERWITLGAPFPPALLASAGKKNPIEAAKTHWAFQPVRPPAAEIRNSIDDLLSEKLAAAGLAPAPPADPRTLIRRVTFDLTGLPPTPEEVAAFEQECRSGSSFVIRDSSLEKLVERLLASPHYGERWARHWLDLVRFCETNGFNRDWTKPNMWRYRDYLIAAFNDDVPYDQFVREQIAGDLMPPRATADGKFNARLAATGLWWSHVRQRGADGADVAEQV